MGTIDTTSKPTYTSQADRNYDSEDENTHRRRLRHTSSTELYPKPSQYSKGDIREQVSFSATVWSANSVTMTSTLFYSYSIV